MDRIDAVAVSESTEPDVPLIETSDHIRLLAQIANGIIAAHARIDILEGRLLDSTKGAVKSGVESLSGENRDALAHLEARIGSWVVELGKVVEFQGNHNSNLASTEISSSTATISQRLTELEQTLYEATGHSHNKIVQQVSLVRDSVVKGFERIEERLIGAEEDEVRYRSHARTTTLRWRLVFLLIGVALLVPQLIQLYHFFMQGRE